MAQCHPESSSRPADTIVARPHYASRLRIVAIILYGGRMTDTSTLQWFQSHQTLVEVGGYLVDIQGYDAENLLYFFEKPWKYEAEWQEFLTWRSEQSGV